MATNAGTLEVVITASTAGLTAALKNARTAVNKGASDFAGLGSILQKGLAVGFGAAVAGAAASIHAFGEAQVSATNLKQALLNQGIASDEAMESILRYSTTLQHLSGISDEAITDAQAILVGFGLEGQALKDATRAALDLSVAKKVDLKVATELLGKAFIGETSTLLRYGIKIDETIPKAQKFAAAMKLIQGTFGGAAAAKGETFFGKLGIAKQDIGDFAEEIGKNLIPVVQRFVQFMIDNRDVLMKAAGDIGRSILSWTDDFANVIKFLRVNKGVMKEALVAAGFGAVLGSAGGPAGALLGAGVGGLLGVGFGLKGAAADPSSVTQPDVRVDTKPSSLTPAGMKAGPGAGGGGGAEDGPKSFQDAWDQAFTKTFDASKVMADNINLVMSGVVGGLSSAINGLLTDILINSQNIGEALKNVGLSLLNTLLGIIAQMIAKWIAAHILAMVTSTSATTGTTAASVAAATTVTVANKLAALSTIAGYRAVAMAGQQAAHSFIPFVGIPIGAAAATTVGALITGYQAAAFLAEGGIVDRPTLAVIGEAGPEAVIPLSKGKDQGIFGGGGDGGGKTEIHFNFDGATLVDGDEAKWDNIARRFIIPALAAYQDKTRSSDLRRWPTRA